MSNYKEPCEICENYQKGDICEISDKCPVALMKAENESLKQEVSKLKHEMSYMINPCTIGDSHEMGSW